MHSTTTAKQGRKINKNLPPNRARDNSRAFRARQATHLQALEQRLSEVEAENNYLRQVLGYPPSSRPPLGRGPTGLQSPPSADPSTAYLHDVPIMQLSGLNDPQRMLLNQSSYLAERGDSSYHQYPMPKNIYFTSPNTSAQSPDGPINFPGGPIDGHGGDDLPPHGEIHDSNETPQQYVYIHFDQKNTDTS